MFLPRLLSAVLLTLLAAPASAQLIVIDPGHGGSDPGAVGCGLEEADVVLDVSLRLEALLEGAGLSAALTRSDDRYVGLSARADYANSRGASRFAAIHANANAGTPATGTETFVAEGGSANSQDMAGRIQREMVDTWSLRDRGVKTARFTVLVRTSMPATLSEMGFINNCSIDAVKLASAAQRQAIAEAHYRAILNHLGRSAPDPTPTPTTGRVRGVIFEDVGAGLEDTSRRLAGARVTAGGGAVTTDESGNFSFDVAAGDTTIGAELDGFVAATRTCTVTAGGETWCSLGLSRAASPPPPPEGSLCSDTCRDAGDGWCDDGGEGSDYSICGLGTDCADCGPRASSEPTPTPEPPTATLYAGLSLGGSAIPRRGLANPTLESTLGLSTEPYGEVVDVDGEAWVEGTVSHFGGPDDMGVPADGTGAITGEIVRELNDPMNPDATTLAARPEDYYYLAMRWSYQPNGRSFWQDARIVLRNPSTGRQVVVRPVDWGPHTSTGRIVDMAPQAMRDLDLVTDDRVQVAFADPRTPLGPVAGTGDGSAPRGPLGTVHGVVFEEHPGGDTSHRVVGATVTVVEDGSDVTTNDVGYFQLQLPVGTWTLEARATGVDPQLRSCEVIADGEVWCSIAVPAGGSAVTRIVLDDGKIRDGAVAGGLTTSGCSATGSGGSGLWLWLLMLPLLLRRRRSAALALVAGMVIVTGCQQSDPADPVESSLASAVPEAVARIELAERVEPFAHLEGVETLHEGPYIDATLSPDGRRIALSHERYAGLSVLDIPGAELSVVAETPRSGLAPLWSRDGERLGIRAPEQSATALPMLARSLEGLEVPPITPSHEVRAWAEDDVIVVMAGAEREELAPPGDRYFDPQISPDGRFVVFRGLSTGLYLWERADGQLLHLGRGDHARFSPDGRWLAFDRLEDDGARFTNGDLFLTDLRHPSRRTAPLHTEGLVHHPSLAGDTVVFLEGDGQVRRARLVF